MENRPFGHEEPDATTSETSSTEKKRGGSKLSRYLAGLRRKEHADTREAEAGDEKPKRLSRIFSRLFPSVVEKPTKDTTESSNYGFDPEAWFGVASFASRAESPQDTSVEVDSSTASSTPEQVSSNTQDQTIVTPQAPVEAGVVESQPTTQAENEPSLPIPEVTPDSGVEVTQVQESPNPQGELFINHEERFDTPPMTTAPETATKETVIERGPGMVLPVALVGLEHLGRKKADKKLEKRVNEKIAATSKEVEQSLALQQELAALRRQNSEQLEALKHARVEKPIESTQPANRIVEQPQPNRPERVANPEKPMVMPEVREQSWSSSEQQPKEEIKPERILEQIADAAEHDIPVERVFERSHEVKDDKSMPGAATSVGTLVNSHAAANQYQALQQGKQLTANIPSGTLPFVSDPVAAAAYKQAVKLGFWAAIMIIILGSIAYLVVK